MLKRLILILAFFWILSVFAESKTVTENNKVFLYMYTKECSYCDKFIPNYNKLEQLYGKKCTFLKQNASTDYGTGLMNDFKATHVPFVALIDYEKHTIQRVAPTCLLNYACVKNAVDKFISQ